MHHTQFFIGQSCIYVAFFTAEIVRESNFYWLSAKVVFIGAWYWRKIFTSNSSWRTEQIKIKEEIKNYANYLIYEIKRILILYQSIVLEESTLATAANSLIYQLLRLIKKQLIEIIS